MTVTYNALSANRILVINGYGKSRTAVLPYVRIICIRKKQKEKRKIERFFVSLRFWRGWEERGITCRLIRHPVLRGFRPPHIPCWNNVPLNA